MTESSYVATFNLSMTRAMKDQLAELLASLEPVPLTAETVDSLEKRGGIYQLFEGGAPVYVGKSTSKLPERLAQHLRKASGRCGGLIDRMTFVCAYVDEDLDAVAPEKLLISQFRAEGRAAWNTNGFGNKDPGKERDTSAVKEAHFDRLYPIDLEKSVTVNLGAKQQLTLLNVMKALKKAMPYNLRFGSDADSVRQLSAIDVSADFVRGDERTVSQWLEWLVARLPDGWVTVALPGYVIAYPALDPETIPSRTGTWRRVNGEVVFTSHQALFAAGDVEVDEEEE